ncbi:MAG: aminopeptidase P family protein [Candidatus Aminicenantes bacterium]|nr:MAG: aminopeptidase P family protein [Candidatus Aminicenantes bacterium]
MFDSKIYTERRTRLKEQVGSGLLLFLGNEESPMNYPANPYHFRQDSSFLYFFGLDTPSLAAIMDVDDGKDVIFGNDVEMEDIIWMGHLPTMKERADLVGVSETAPLPQLKETIKEALQKGKTIHYLPPYRPESVLKIAQLLGIEHDSVKKYASKDFIKAVVAQRNIKIPEEIAQMELAHEVTNDMYLAAMRMAKQGVFEYEIVGKMEGIIGASDCHVAFPIILTKNGQILHNHYHGNQLAEGDLLVMDSGSESPMNYASDITRTVPVGGKFTEKQRQIYEIVLQAQEMAIQNIKPGITFKDIHLLSAAVIASGLKEAGLMKGDMAAAVDEGAHALFFPHGLGHMIGLDVHDMEGLGEDYVGYDHTVERSSQFGLAYLRLAKELESGNVVTVEPGIYFIPTLIDQWASEKKFEQFIDYAKVEEYRNFGGIRIEDDILVTQDGSQVLGKSIPKKVEDIEKITATE